MDEKERKTLESLGWPPEILDSLSKRSPAMKAVDRMFLDRARSALAEAGYSALEFLAANSELSIIDLAKRLNRGANAVGLIMAIYGEATKRGVVREIAKDLLIRKINEEFPKGWKSDEKIHASVKIGSWDFDIDQYAGDRAIGSYASHIARRLTIDQSPPEGWKPKRQNDPLIDELFDRYWPVITGDEC